MNKLTKIHDQAMDIAELAFLERRRGEEGRAEALFNQAYEIEKDIALKVEEEPESEPSRSVLFRSAATLAYHAGKLEEAAELLDLGLSPNTPAIIIDEMEELRGDIAMSLGASPELPTIRVRGMLTYANAEEKKIRITHVNGKAYAYDLHVPKGMAEIVRSYWEQAVWVEGRELPGRSRIFLLSIEKAD